MPIYTKTGDAGETAVFGGKRLLKCDWQVEAYGAVDEASSFIGWAKEVVTMSKDKQLLTLIQKNLYLLMSYLAGASLQANFNTNSKELEQEIDKIEHRLPQLRQFILPQGGEAASRLHLARTQVRRAERKVVAYFYRRNKLSLNDQQILIYINRLSDFLFMLARKYSIREEIV